MKKILIAMFVLSLSCAACFGQTTANSKQRPGILLLAHGGSLTWNEDVRHIADKVDLSLPTEVAFGMATRSAMQSAIDRLIVRKVTEIIAVPLFVSSHSSVIESQNYLLGQSAQMPEELKDFVSMDHGAMGKEGEMGHGVTHDPAAAANAMRPVISPVPIHMASALDAHPIVADILLDRAASISSDPSHEVVILVAHGPVSDEGNKLWLKDMSALADQMRGKAQYAAIDFLTLRDDADKPVRDAATKELRQKVERAAKTGNETLIVPLLISYGGIEGGLRKRLKGLEYRMPSQGLLPDGRITDWVVDEAEEFSAKSAAAKK
ncbi:MAG TPA: CbiX/SirB N-terminal domain-containing protein [Terracidiphilus sp.]|nr:CbiX/SirB N-terminal domain-containing protein [Terracidiphilus sp.]